MITSDGYGQVVSKGVRVQDEDVAKGLGRAIRNYDPSNPKHQAAVYGTALVGTAAVGEIGGRKIGQSRYKAGKHVNDGFFMGPAVNRGYYGAERKANPGRKYGAARTADDTRVRKGFEEVSKAPSLMGIRQGASRLGGSAKAGWKAGRTGAAKPMGPQTLGQQRVGQLAQGLGQRPVLAGAMAGGAGMAAMTGGNGMNNRYTPSPPPVYFNKALSGDHARRLRAVKGKIELGPEGVRERQAIYSRIGIGSKQNRVEMNPKGNFAVSDGMPRATRRRGHTYDDVERAMRKKPTSGDTGGVFKRTYDPEDERRFRQGAYAAGTAGAGGLALVGAARGVNRDTAALNRLRSIQAGKAPNEPKRNYIDPKTKKIRAALPGEKTAARREHAENMNNWHKLGQAELDAKKVRGGRVVRGRYAALGAGGVGLLGLSGALHSRRNEERWD